MTDFIKLYKKSGNNKVLIHPETSASHVLINDAAGQASNVGAEIGVLRQRITDLVQGNVTRKGGITQASDLPTTGYKNGWMYVVKAAGTYAGAACEIGDVIFCVKDYDESTASNADWTVWQANINGAVVGPASATDEHVALFDGTTGKVIKDSGLTLGRSVPADAVFLTSAEKTKLDGIDSGAEVNQNAVAKVKVGANTIEAAAKQDTIEFEAGPGITMSADTTNKKVTISESYVDVCSVSSLNSVPANLRDGGLIILTEE